MVLDQDGKVTAQKGVGKNNEAHAVAFAPDLQLGDAGASCVRQAVPSL